MKLKSYTKKDRYGNMTSFEFYEGASVDMGDIPPMMEGIPDHPGEPKGTDTVPAWLTPGEFVMNAEATRMFEPQIEEMNNAGRAVQAQQGGTIPEYAASGGQMPAAKMDGDKFAKAAMAVGLPTDNATLNKLVNLVNQGMSVQEAAKRIASVPQYSANGGPVYLAEGSGGLLDSLMGLFKDNPEIMGDPEVAKQVARATAEVSKDTTDGEDLGNAPSVREATSLAPTMQNAAYMNLIKDTEGFKNEAYLDSAGVPTIGYGFTKGVKMGDTMDKETADKRLVQEMAVADKDYNNLVNAQLNPNQQAAVKSLLYNIGGPQFANSKARAALNAGDFDTFQKEAAEFRMANGKVIPGLENRRAKELSLFNTPYQQANQQTQGTLQQSVMNQLAPPPVLMGEPTGSRGSGEYLDTGEGNRTPPALNEPPEINEFSKFDTNQDGVVDKDEARAAAQASQEKPTQVSPGIRITPSGGEIMITGPDSLIARNEQILDDLIDSNASPEDIATQAKKLEVIVDSNPNSDRAKANVAKRNAERPVLELDSQIEKIQKRLDAFKKAGLTERAASAQEQLDDLNAQREPLIPALETATAAEDAFYTDAIIDGKRVKNVSKIAANVLQDKGTADEAMDAAIEGQDAETDDSPLSKEAQEAINEIVNDNVNLQDDNTASDHTVGNTENAAKEPDGTLKPEVEKSESFLKGIFGDLLDTDELRRMAIMYAGSRIMGGSHAGSLNFAAKQYVTRVDKKVSDHKAYVKKLTEDGTYEPKSIALYNKTKNIADLAKKGATYSNTGGSTLTKMVPITGKDGNNKGYKKATLVPVKNSITGSIDYQLPDGSVVPSVTANNLADHREEFERGSEAYKARRSRIKSDMSKRFDEVREQSGIKAPAGDGKQKEYYTNVGPEKAADQYFAWSESLGPQFDPESAEAMNILTLAQEQMIREAKDPGTKYKPSNLTKYLNFQKIRADTGAENLFLINPKQVSSKKEEPKFVRMDKMEKLYGNMDALISQIPNNTTSRSDIFATGVSNWNKLSPKDQEQYSSKASRSAGESGFYKFMEATIPALFEALNKT